MRAVVTKVLHIVFTIVYFVSFVALLSVFFILDTRSVPVCFFQWQESDVSEEVAETCSSFNLNILSIVVLGIAAFGQLLHVILRSSNTGLWYVVCMCFMQNQYRPFSYTSEETPLRQTDEEEPLVEDEEHDSLLQTMYMKQRRSPIKYIIRMVTESLLGVQVLLLNRLSSGFVVGFGVVVNLIAQFSYISFDAHMAKIPIRLDSFQRRQINSNESIQLVTWEQQRNAVGSSLLWIPWLCFLGFWAPIITQFGLNAHIVPAWLPAFVFVMFGLSFVWKLMHMYQYAYAMFIIPFKERQIRDKLQVRFERGEWMLHTMMFINRLTQVWFLFGVTLT